MNFPGHFLKQRCCLLLLRRHLRARANDDSVIVPREDNLGGQGGEGDSGKAATTGADAPWRRESRPAGEGGQQPGRRLWGLPAAVSLLVFSGMVLNFQKASLILKADQV